MIIVEDRLKELFDGLPDITVGSDVFTPLFDFGSKDDLNILIKEEEAPYPLIWLVSEFQENKNEKDHVNVKLNFVLATCTDSVMKNSERLEYSFKGVLIPLFENMLKAFCRSNIAIMVNQDYTITKHYNYGSGIESNTLDIWDAIQFEIELNIYDNVLKTVNYYG